MKEERIKKSFDRGHQLINKPMLQISLSPACPYYAKIKSDFNTINTLTKKNQKEHIIIKTNQLKQTIIYIRDINDENEYNIDPEKDYILSFHPKRPIEFPISDYKAIIIFIRLLIDHLLENNYPHSNTASTNESTTLPYHLMSWEENAALQEDEVVFFEKKENQNLLFEDPTNIAIPLRIRQFLENNYFIQ